MMRVFWMLVICGLAFGLERPARAERDLVYSARYYLKPGSKGQSHLHLYRINIDGTRRTQLTRGSADDYVPRWSSDGRKVAFLRMSSEEQAATLFLIDADGNRRTKVLSSGKGGWIDTFSWAPRGNVLGVVRQFDNSGVLYLIDTRTLGTNTPKMRRWNDVEDFRWSPDGRRICATKFHGRPVIIDVASGRETPLLRNLNGFEWIDNDTLATLDGSADLPSSTVSLLDTTGRVERRLTLRLPDTDAINFRSRFYRIPGQSQVAIFALDNHTSSGADTIYYRFDLHSANARKLSGGNELMPHRDNRFSVVTYHDVTPYQKRANGSTRYVYTTKLQIGNVNAVVNGGRRDVVSGLVYVGGCDWR